MEDWGIVTEKMNFPPLLCPPRSPIYRIYRPLSNLCLRFILLKNLISGIFHISKNLSVLPLLLAQHQKCAFHFRREFFVGTTHTFVSLNYLSSSSLSSLVLIIVGRLSQSCLCLVNVSV